MANLKHGGYFNKPDGLMCAYSIASFIYVTVLADWQKLKQFAVAVVLFGIVLLLLVLLFTSWYRQKCALQTNGAGRKRYQVDYTFWLFAGVASLLWYPMYFDPALSMFQWLFPVMAGAVFGWAEYLDGRFFYVAKECSGYEPGYLKEELGFHKMLIQQLLWFYGFMLISVTIGLDKMEVLMGKRNDMGAMVMLGAGIALIVAEVHYLTMTRLFLRSEEIMKELGKGRTRSSFRRQHPN